MHRCPSPCELAEFRHCPSPYGQAFPMDDDDGLCLPPGRAHSPPDEASGREALRYSGVGSSLEPKRQCHRRLPMVRVPYEDVPTTRGRNIGRGSPVHPVTRSPSPPSECNMDFYFSLRADGLLDKRDDGGALRRGHLEPAEKQRVFQEERSHQLPDAQQDQRIRRSRTGQPSRPRPSPTRTTPTRTSPTRPSPTQPSHNRTSSNRTSRTRPRRTRRHRTQASWTRPSPARPSSPPPLPGRTRTVEGPGWTLDF